MPTVAMGPITNPSREDIGPPPESTTQFLFILFSVLVISPFCNFYCFKVQI